MSQQQNAQYLCLDLLLAFVNDMAARAEGVRNLSLCLIAPRLTNHFSSQISIGLQ